MRLSRVPKNPALAVSLTLSFLALGVACLPAGDAAPLFETTCVFPITPDNKPNYRIPALIQAPNGDLLVLAEKRNDGPGDVGNHDIVLKRSRDHGRTWGPEQVVFDDEDRVCTDLTVGLDTRSGRLWLFFLRDKKRFCHFSSTDSGHTWQGPVDVHAQVTRPGWDALRLPKKPGAEPSANPKGRMARWEKDWDQRYGCGPGKGMVLLKTGRLVLPARHREDIGQGRLRSFTHAIYSDDAGATWRLGGSLGMHTSECQFEALADGRLLAVARDENPADAPDNIRHLAAVSTDGGLTWGPVRRLEELISPRCHGSVERYTQAGVAGQGKNRLLFCSPASPIRQEEHPYGRYNLTVRLSEDEGATWSAGRTLWPHPGSYSDLVVFEDFTVGCIYERAEKGSTHYWDELHFARFDLAWITRSAESLPAAPAGR